MRCSYLAAVAGLSGARAGALLPAGGSMVVVVPEAEHGGIGGALAAVVLLVLEVLGLAGGRLLCAVVVGVYVCV